MQDIRVRIAPSPSGNLHVGTARTALFNYLFAKKEGGKFILRIEDTDLGRSEEAYIKNIYDGLSALGLKWDEGPDIGGPFNPYKQSERFHIYKKYAEKLLDAGKAYKCFCTEEDLEQEKQQAINNKVPYTYTRKCLSLDQHILTQYENENKPYALRFKVPRTMIDIKDLIRGIIKFDTGLIGDFVIIKSDGSASYNFSVVIDDIDMEISHVIRGEDHISNTPRQILIYEALGKDLPVFAHCGMILAPDRTKLSKRHGATAVVDYIKEGYLPAAFVNFLALLGWSPSDGVEIKTVDQIIQDFSVEKIAQSPAIFDIEKLNWLNGQYINTMPIDELTRLAEPFLAAYRLDEYTQAQREKIVALVREPMKKLSEITEDVRYFFGNEVTIDNEVKEQVLNKPYTVEILNKFLEIEKSFDYQDTETIKNSLGDLRKSFKENGIKPQEVMFCIRASLTGRVHGADLASVISLLGRDKVIYRVESAKKESAQVKA